jgi:hypothetical protein
VSYAFTRNGAFVGGGGGTYRPGAVDRSGGSRFATVRFDDAASWRVVVLWSDGSRALDVETSLPLVVT